MKAHGIEFVQIKAAPPGWYVLEAVGDGNGYPVDVHKAHVIHWALEADTLAPYPITSDGVQTENVYLLDPDGSVERPCVDWFPSVDDWLQEQQRAYLAKQGGAA